MTVQPIDLEEDKLQHVPNRTMRRSWGNYRSAGRGRAFRRRVLTLKVQRYPELAIRRELAKLKQNAS